PCRASCPRPCRLRPGPERTRLAVDAPCHEVPRPPPHRERNGESRTRGSRECDEFVPTRVIVTRAAAQAQPLADALRGEGYAVVLCPLIEIEPIEDGPIDVGGDDWVVGTSATGAERASSRRRREH